MKFPLLDKKKFCWNQILINSITVGTRLHYVGRLFYWWKKYGGLSTFPLWIQRQHSAVWLRDYFWKSLMRLPVWHHSHNTCSQKVVDLLQKLLWLYWKFWTPSRQTLDFSHWSPRQTLSASSLIKLSTVPCFDTLHLTVEIVKHEALRMRTDQHVSTSPEDGSFANVSLAVPAHTVV